MIKLTFNLARDQKLKLLCLGAHSDDIEIGCGGTLLRLAEEHPECELYWVVFSASGIRKAEAKRGMSRFAGPNWKRTFVCGTFRDGFMPYAGSKVKDLFEDLKRTFSPHIIFTHWGGDAHQDHRLVSELTWNTFRDHLILEYEVPKYDGDIGRPGVFVPLANEICDRKIANLLEIYRSQRSRKWFEENTFRALMRLRGMECASDSQHAEAFHCRKMAL